jgi:arginine exporter protein ArgO
MNEHETKILLLQNLQQNITEMISLNRFDPHKYLEAIALIGKRPIGAAFY